MKPDREHIIYELINCDNWEIVDQIDTFLFIFDHMPNQMRLVIDLKIQGYNNQEIADILKVNYKTVYTQLNRAKQRFFKALFA